MRENQDDGLGWKPLKLPLTGSTENKVLKTPLLQLSLERKEVHHTSQDTAYLGAACGLGFGLACFTAMRGPSILEIPGSPLRTKTEG